MSHIDNFAVCLLHVQPDERAPLHGVVIAVAKKLGASHEEYNTIAVELGGDYSWKHGEKVTHFVFQVSQCSSFYLSVYKYFLMLV